MASVKRDDPKTQDTLSACYKMITDVMIGDEATWVLLTQSGKSILSQRKPVVGTPVIVRVVVRHMSEPVAGQRNYVVSVAGIDQELRITDPVGADEIDSGTALVGGLLERPLAGDNKMVLARGFLVAPPIDRTWWWWYGVRPRSNRDQ